MLADLQVRFGDHKKNEDKSLLGVKNLSYLQLWVLGTEH